MWVNATWCFQVLSWASSGQSVKTSQNALRPTLQQNFSLLWPLNMHAHVCAHAHLFTLSVSIWWVNRSISSSRSHARWHSSLSRNLHSCTTFLKNSRKPPRITRRRNAQDYLSVIPSSLLPHYFFMGARSPTSITLASLCSPAMIRLCLLSLFSFKVA